jgi:hypothetical protein
MDRLRASRAWSVFEELMVTLEEVEAENIYRVDYEDMHKTAQVLLEDAQWGRWVFDLRPMHEEETQSSYENRESLRQKHRYRSMRK